MTARILIVEDEEALTLLLRYNLEAEGYQVAATYAGNDEKAKAFTDCREQHDVRP